LAESFFFSFLGKVYTAVYFFILHNVNNEVTKKGA
jgi:hypothetical protein